MSRYRLTVCPTSSTRNTYASRTTVKNYYNGKQKKREKRISKQKQLRDRICSPRGVDGRSTPASCVVSLVSTENIKWYNSVLRASDCVCLGNKSARFTVFMIAVARKYNVTLRRVYVLRYYRAVRRTIFYPLTGVFET